MAASDKLQEAIGSLALQHAGDGGCWDVSEDVLGKKPKEQQETKIFREFNKEANPVNSCTLGVSESERAVREIIPNNSSFYLIVFLKRMMMMMTTMSWIVCWTAILNWNVSAEQSWRK